MSTPPPNRRSNSLVGVVAITVPFHRRTAKSAFRRLIECRRSPSPSCTSAFTAFGQSDIPAPTSLRIGLLSWTSASMPFLRNAIAAVRPPIPPPTIRTFIAIHQCRRGNSTRILLRCVCDAPRLSPAILLLVLEANPVLEFVGIQFAVQVGDAPGEARLRVGDGLVVDGRPYLFENEIQQQACGQFANGLRQFLAKIALDGCDGFGARLFR